MEKNMDKYMTNEMETGVIKRLSRDPSQQIIPSLGPKVCTLPALGYLDPPGNRHNEVPLRTPSFYVALLGGDVEGRVSWDVPASIKGS